MMGFMLMRLAQTEMAVDAAICLDAILSKQPRDYRVEANLVLIQQDSYPRDYFLRRVHV
jgi:hypothetical protein